MTELHVSKKTIRELLGDMWGKKFIIPDFQRPYMWDEERCQTLWGDILDFHKNDAEAENDLYYFLGTIVFYYGEDEEQTGKKDLGRSNRNPKIIDGQQRITSLFLLLRAFYKKLEGLEKDDIVTGLKNQLALCIWDTNKSTQQVTDKSKIHIQSLVATEEDNDIFHDILRDGESEGMARDSYSTNYRFFEEKWAEFMDKHRSWDKLCLTILDKCVILPIECNTSETALTIFSTLNDRGMPLADSDIFKAKIYRAVPAEKKREFTETWKELSTICDESKDSGLSINDVFRYYSHVLRAQKGEKAKEIGLRKFYGKDQLNDRDTMNNVIVIAKFWQSINSDKTPDPQEGYEISTDARKYLHCLSKYPNDFWKYATTVFFIKNKGSSSFENDFVSFLKKMTAFLFAKFTISPTVNAIKDDIFAACISLYKHGEIKVSSVKKDKDSEPEVIFFKFDWDSVSRRMGESRYGLRFSTALLLLDAYLHPSQKELISEKCQIEHIFPKKWQNTNYNGWNEEEAERYLELLGNKVIIEKKVNIQAGNGYFGKKKQKYQASQIARVLDLAESPKEDWSKEDIEYRESELRIRLIDFFKEQLEVG